MGWLGACMLLEAIPDINHSLYGKKKIVAAVTIYYNWGKVRVHLCSHGYSCMYIDVSGVTQAHDITNRQGQWGHSQTHRYSKFLQIWWLGSGTGSHAYN